MIYIDYGGGYPTICICLNLKSSIKIKKKKVNILYGNLKVNKIQSEPKGKKEQTQRI